MLRCWLVGALVEPTRALEPPHVVTESLSDQLVNRLVRMDTGAISPGAERATIGVKSQLSFFPRALGPPKDFEVAFDLHVDEARSFASTSLDPQSPSFRSAGGQIAKGVVSM